MRNLLFVLFMVVMGCSSKPPKTITLEYDSFCAIHVEKGADYYKVLPMCDDAGKIIIYEDSISFIGVPDSLNYTLYPIGFNGDPNMSRMIQLIRLNLQKRIKSHS